MDPLELLRAARDSLAWDLTRAACPCGGEDGACGDCHGTGTYSPLGTRPVPPGHGWDGLVAAACGDPGGLRFRHAYGVNGGELAFVRPPHPYWTALETIAAEARLIAKATPPPTVSSKRCVTCTVTRPASAFWRNRTKRDGLQDACKECHHKRRAEMSDERRTAENERRRARYARKVKPHTREYKDREAA